MKTEVIENTGVGEIKKLCALHGISPMELSMHLGVTWTRIYEILSGRRRITADTDIRLCHFFQQPVGYFAVLQLQYDLAIEQRNLQGVLAKMKNVKSVLSHH